MVELRGPRPHRPFGPFIILDTGPFSQFPLIFQFLPCNVSYTPPPRSSFDVITRIAATLTIGDVAVSSLQELCLKLLPASVQREATRDVEDFGQRDHCPRTYLSRVMRKTQEIGAFFFFGQSSALAVDCVRRLIARGRVSGNNWLHSSYKILLIPHSASSWQSNELSAKLPSPIENAEWLNRIIS